MTGTFQCEGGCGRELKEFKRRKTRLCRNCCAAVIARDPAKAAKASATIKRLYQDPVFRSRQQRACKAGVQASIANNPVERERRRLSGQALAATGLGHAAQTPGSEPRIRAGKSHTETVLGWCPPHLRDEYRKILGRQGMRKEDARRKIEEMMAAEVASRRNGRMSFEEQLRRANAGVAVVRKFEPRKPDHDFTLGGVATGMI